MLRSTPPLTATSYCRDARPCAADHIAASPEAQAASVVKFGPRKLNRLAIRPAMTFASSPGMVSSLISAKFARYAFWVSSRIARRAFSG